MTIQEDIAKAIVRKRHAELAGLPPEQRAEVVTGILDRLNEKSEDELVTFFSARQPGISPELESEMETQAGILKQQEAVAGVRGRPPGERRLFQPGETLPLDVQASRLDTRKQQQEAELQELGVSTREPLPGGDIELGFGADQVESLTNALTKQFGEPVTVFRRGQDVLYIDPTDDVVKKANPNMLGSAGQGLPVAGDVIGTVGGGLTAGALTKNPAGIVAGETIGSTAGTGTGEYLRLMIGRSIGANDLSLPEIYMRAGLEGGKAGVATAVTGGMIASTKGLRNFLKGGIFTKNEALKQGFSSKEADIIVDEVNKILKGKATVKGTLFKKTDDILVGNQEAQVRKNIAHAADFVERDLADQRAAAKALGMVTETPKGGKMTVSDVAAQQVRRRTTQARAIAAKNASQLKSQLDEIGRVRKELVGEPTRNVLIEKSKATQNSVDEAWESVKQLGGFNAKTNSYGIDIPIGDETKLLRKVLKRRSDTATTKVTTDKIFGAKKKKAADLADYSREISDLKSEIRTARKNRQFGNPQISDMEKAVKAMEADRRAALTKIGRQDLIESIEQAEKATASFHKTYNRSIIGDLTKKNENGVFTIQSTDFVDKMLKGSGEEADQLLQVIGDAPSLMMKWKEGIADAYKRKAFKNGVFNRTQSDQFIEQNAEVLKRFFEPTDIAKFKQTGKLAELVKKQDAQMTRILRNADSKFGRGKLKSLDPDKVVDFVTNNTGSFATPSGRGIQVSLNKIKYVKGITKSQPEVWRRFQSDYSDALRKSLMDPEKGFVNPKAISDAVNKKGDVIAEVMGPKYLDDLRKVNKVIQILDRTPKLLTTSEARAGIIQVIRSGAAPPLTRRGRAFTAAVIFDTKRAHDVIAKALLDPSTMGQVAKLAEHSTLNREAIELAVSLGIITSNDLGVQE